MRTTITFEPDVAAAIEQERRRGRSVSEVVNELVRLGLRPTPPSTASFVQKTSAMGPSRVPLDSIAEALDAIEGDARR
ncbi:MAG: CopG family transcriptional regulator [Acidimicrobiia bacterium]